MGEKLGEKSKIIHSLILTDLLNISSINVIFFFFWFCFVFLAMHGKEMCDRVKATRARQNSLLLQLLNKFAYL